MAFGVLHVGLATVLLHWFCTVSCRYSLIWVLIAVVLVL